MAHTRLRRFFFAIILTLIVFGTSPGISGQHYEFRGVRLGAPKTDDMVPHTDSSRSRKETQWHIGAGTHKKIVEVCERRGDKKSIGSIPVRSIEYYYMDGLLLKVEIWANPYYADDLDEVLQIKFGAPYKNAPVQKMPYWITHQYVRHAVIAKYGLDLSLIRREYNSSSADAIIVLSDVALLREYNALVAAEEKERMARQEQRKRDASNDI